MRAMWGPLVFGFLGGCALRGAATTTLAPSSVRHRVLLTAPEVTDHDLAVLSGRAGHLGRHQLTPTPEGAELLLGRVDELQQALGQLLQPGRLTFQPVLSESYDIDAAGVPLCGDTDAVLCERGELGPPALDGLHVATAEHQLGWDGITWVVLVTFTEAGGEAFCELTQAEMGSRIAVVLDGEVLIAPTIREPICGGSALIESGAGPLPAEAAARAAALSARVRYAAAGALEQPWTIATLE